MSMTHGSTTNSDIEIGNAAAVVDHVREDHVKTMKPQSS